MFQSLVCIYAEETPRARHIPHCDAGQQSLQPSVCVNNVLSHECVNVLRKGALASLQLEHFAAFSIEDAGCFFQDQSRPRLKACSDMEINRTIDWIHQPTAAACGQVVHRWSAPRPPRACSLHFRAWPDFLRLFSYSHLAYEHVK